MQLTWSQIRNELPKQATIRMALARTGFTVSYLAALPDGMQCKDNYSTTVFSKQRKTHSKNIQEKTWLEGGETGLQCGRVT